MGSCKRDFHCSGETAVSDRETGDMFVSAGSAACFGSVPCREQGIERGLQVHWIRDRPYTKDRKKKIENGKQACVACFF